MVKWVSHLKPKKNKTKPTVEKYLLCFDLWFIYPFNKLCWLVPGIGFMLKMENASNKYTHLTQGPSKLHHFRSPGSHLSVAQLPESSLRSSCLPHGTGRRAREGEGSWDRGAGPCMRNRTWSPAWVLWVPQYFWGCITLSSGYTMASSVRHSDGSVSDEQTFTPDRSFLFLIEKSSVKLVGNSPTSKSNLESLCLSY